MHPGPAQSRGAAGYTGRPRPHLAQRLVPGAGRQGGGGPGGGRGHVLPRPRQAAAQARQVSRVVLGGIVSGHWSVDIMYYVLCTMYNELCILK